MQNAGLGNPPVQDGEQTPPARLSTFTASAVLFASLPAFRLARRRAECRTARASHRSEPSRHVHGAGTPGTGIYAARHIRRSSGEHPTVAGSAWPVILLLAVLLSASRVKACA